MTAVSHAQAINKQSSGASLATSTGQTTTFDDPEIDASTLAGDLSQFNSFDRTEPGSEIGSNFFGLNDNFDPGTFAQNRSTNVDDLFPDELDNVTYFAGNLICTTTKNSNFGIEYLYGLRENFDGQSAQANRIQVAFSYFLP